MYYNKCIFEREVCQKRLICLDRLQRRQSTDACNGEQGKPVSYPKEEIIGMEILPENMSSHHKSVNLSITFQN